MSGTPRDLSNWRLRVNPLGTLLFPILLAVKGLSLIERDKPVRHLRRPPPENFTTLLAPATAVPIDAHDLVFSVANPSNTSLDLGFNIWSNGGNSYSSSWRIPECRYLHTGLFWTV